VLLDMVSTVDGRASLGGRSGAIGDLADRQFFHALRTVVDGVMVGAGTARAERYGRLIKTEEARALRHSRGLREEPLACFVSGRLDLPADLPLLQEPAARVAIITSSGASLAGSAARVDYVRVERDGRLDLALALQELTQKFGIRTLLCEGGPHLNGELLAAGLVDELFLTLGPKLAGEDPAGPALRIVAGTGLEPPVELRLVDVFAYGSELFLRYRVRDEASA
jgi:riboflavin biosynthesis pyrimidine reductase